MDSAYAYIDKSVRLSRELGDSANVYYHLELLARAYLVDSLPLKAKDVAVTIIKNGGKDITDSDVYFDAANAYVQLNMLDSASYYYENRPCDDHSPSQTVIELIFKTSFYLAQGKYAEAYEANRRCTVLADSIADSNNKMQLFELEKRYDKELLEKENLKMKEEKLILYLFLVIGFILLLLAWGIIYKRRQQMEKAQSFILQLQEEAVEIKHNLESKTNAEALLKEVMGSQIDNIRHLIDLSYSYEGKPSLFMKAFRQRVRSSQTDNSSFIQGVQKFVDLNYNNLISDISKKHPTLKNEELTIIALLRCGFSYIEISICMGYESLDYVNTKKFRIAKKMGLNVSLKNYIEKYC